MQCRQLGKCGLRVSSLGLGSYLTIGYKCDEQTSAELIRYAYEHGINYYDTANGYNRGQAEEVLGKYLKDYDRASLVILTKVWAPMGSGPNDRGLSAKHIIEQCHASLKRLQTDYVDIYMAHRSDPSVPLEETIRAMEDLARQGKILYWGVSEWSAALMTKATAVAASLGARGPIVNQPRYNLLYRYPEQDVFGTTLADGMGNVILSPLAHGMLTGKYLPGRQAAAGTRAADPDQNTVMMNMYWSEENKQRAQQLVRIAQELKCSAAQLAVAWCLKHPAVSSVILGARTLDQLKDNLGAVEVTIAPEVMAKLDELYPQPAGIPTA